jgi:F-type H+-transporting ATPase subunit alpha
MNINPTEFASLLQQKIEHEKNEDWRNSGRIISLKDGVLTIAGLENASSMEILVTENGAKALVFNLEEEMVKAILLCSGTAFQNELVYTTGEVIKVPVGNFFGRIVNALGEPIDDLGTIKFNQMREIEQESTPIIGRKSVTKPLQTGITAIDIMIPIGRGQREMILGDKRTGKTSIALDTIIHIILIHQFSAYMSQ